MNIGGLIEKFGAGLAGLLITAAGLTELLPFMGIPEHLAHGVVWTGCGLAIVVFGRKWQKSDSIYIASEAEKRIQNPNLPSISAVPQIQKEIEKQTRATGGTV